MADPISLTYESANEQHLIGPVEVNQLPDLEKFISKKDIEWLKKRLTPNKSMVIVADHNKKPLFFVVGKVVNDTFVSESAGSIGRKGLEYLEEHFTDGSGPEMKILSDKSIDQDDAFSFLNNIQDPRNSNVKLAAKEDPLDDPLAMRKINEDELIGNIKIGPLNRLLPQLLDKNPLPVPYFLPKPKNPGVFIGELHLSPSMTQSIAMLLPALKAHGVGTVSLELPQAMIDEIMQQPTPERAKELFPTFEHAARIHALGLQAKSLNIKMLGHEKPKDVQPPIEGDYDGTTPINMNKRNEWAADYIKKHAVGKVIVIGGNAHSKKLWVGEEELSGYKPLNTLLGYPSVDYLMSTDRDPGPQIGQTHIPLGYSADSKVELPLDLLQSMKKWNLTSWPPLKGSPEMPNTSPLPPEVRNQSPVQLGTSPTRK